MSKRKRGFLSGKHAFTKGVLTTLAGATVGVVANKAMNTVFGATNPAIMAPIVASDIVTLGAEIGGAFYAKKRRKPKYSKFLIDMAAGSTAATVVKVANAASWWGVLTPTTMRYNGTTAPSRMGKYGNTAPLNGKIGGFMMPINYTYPRR